LTAYSGLATEAGRAAGARVLARGKVVEVHEAGVNERTVIIEFDSVAQAVAAYESVAYRKAPGRPRRCGGNEISESSKACVEGYDSKQDMRPRRRCSGKASNRVVTKIQRERHALPSEIPHSQNLMERASVVRRRPKTEPTLGRFAGWVEEVDTGEELRFRSTEELLRFLGERFDEALGRRAEKEGGSQCLT